MKIGTKSVLFGAHCFFIHPWFVFFAWWKLYGFPWDYRLWVAFFVHDLGYWGKPNMDGAEGETHVEFGARIMHKLFDPFKVRQVGYPGYYGIPVTRIYSNFWRDLCLYHSRFYAKRDGVKYSKLCPADKLAVAMEPMWLYLPRVILSGEICEYMTLAGKRKYDGEPLSKYESMNLDTGSKRDWFKTMTSYLRRWAIEHSDGRMDTWTPEIPQANNHNNKNTER